MIISLTTTVGFFTRIENPMVRSTRILGSGTECKFRSYVRPFSMHSHILPDPPRLKEPSVSP